jgi:hypothetical protein
MALSQTKFAGTGKTNGGLGNPWGNPTRIVADDGSYTNAVIQNTYTEYLVSAQTGNLFTIPSNASIKGIVVEYQAYYGDAGATIQDKDVYLTKSATGTTTAVGDDKGTQTWTVTTPTVQTYGSATDLWGTTWTPAEINSADFGVMISASGTGANTNIYIDYVKITVYYQVSGLLMCF